MEYGVLAEASELLQLEIQSALKRGGVNAREIGIVVQDGVVTLTGYANSLADALAAERVVKRVEGVRSIANDVHVRARHESTDTDIAREALHRLRNNVAVPQSVQALVRDSRITLEGTVRWMHQRSAAEAAVKYVAGVSGVDNAIVVATTD